MSDREAGCLLVGTAGAAVEEWTSIHPAGPTSSIGGPVEALGVDDSGNAYLVSLLGKLHKRTAIGQPWVQIPVTLNGSTALLTGLHVGPGSPPVLLGKLGRDRLARSPDGGATWTELSLPTTGTGSSGWIRGVAIAPGDPELIYYNVRLAVWRSTDGGQNWEQRTAAAPSSESDLQLHPLSTSTLYLASGGDFFTSVDGGQNWSPMMNGIAPDLFLGAVGVDPTSLLTLYTGGQDEIYKSTDAAANWSLVETGAEYEAIAAIAVDPINPANVYAVAEDILTGGLYYSSDGGVSWGRDGGAGEWGALFHVDVSPGGEVLAGGNIGIKSSSDGVVFTQTNAGFNDFYVYNMAIAPSNEDVLYAVGWRGGVMASFDGGQTWSLRYDGIEPGQGRRIAVDPTDPMHVFYGDENELYESTDGGQSWQTVDLGNDLGYKGSVTIAPSDPDRLYLHFGNLLTSGDGGQTWTSVLDIGISVPPVPVVVAHDEPATVYVGVYGVGAFKSTNAGASWIALHAGGLPNYIVNAIALDRNDPQRIVLGLDNNIVVESLDGGANWTDISANLPAGFQAPSSVAIDNFTGDLYVFLSPPLGVYKRNPDDGQWQKLDDVFVENNSLPKQVIPSLQTPGRLFLQAAEMFRFDFDTDADGADNCIEAANPDQRDTDGDQFGNLCDPDIAPAVNDCQVNFLDLNVMKSNFFDTGDLDTDLNGDNQTNFADLTIMKDYFFGAPGPSGPAFCP